jgi:hypothetical protein
MNRQEQIKKEANNLFYEESLEEVDAFIIGAYWADANPDPEREAAIQKLVEACVGFKKSFYKGFPNSLNAIESRDRIFEALEAWNKLKG